MTQADRDRLVTLKKAASGAIRQRQAAAEQQVSERQVRRLLAKLRWGGDQAIWHGLRGRRSHRKIDDAVEQRAVTILRQDVYRGFGPTLAGEYLAKKHGIQVSEETARKWTTKAGLWRAHPRRVVEVHTWRERRERFGELVQWDNSEHDWTEGRGEKMYVVSMIDDATSRVLPASCGTIPVRRTDSNYHATPKQALPTGHFYFAGNRTFLLCRGRISCRGVPCTYGSCPTVFARFA